MTRVRRVHQLLGWLEEDNHTTELRRQEMLSELEGVLEAAPRWLLPGLAARIARACDAPIPTSTALAPGESLLLLRDPISRAGLVTRLRVSSDGTERDGLSRAARSQSRIALRALRSTIARQGRAWPAALAPSLDVEVFGLAPDERVDESSLGLSVALAEASRLSNAPLRGDIAATAEVREDGSLAPVRFLREKIHALRVDAPEVRSVVVARGTPRDGVEDSDLEIVEVDTLQDALARWEITFDALEHASIDQAEATSATLEADAKRPHTPNEWHALADRAVIAALVLEQDLQPARALRCRAWAALFRVHAGSPEEARACLRPGDESACDISVRAMVTLSRASAEIDRGAGAALALAEQGVALARAGSDRSVLARALGTLGRAHTSAGAPASGAASLLEAIELFERVDAPQSDQTRCYLATSLRLQGRAREALSTAREAHARCEVRRGSEYARETARYLSLEIGRCLMELDQLDEARLALARVHRADLGDDSYPNIGALASLAHIEAAEGNLSGASFARCLAVASANRTLIGRVAAQALGWRLSQRNASADESIPWHRVWLTHAPRAITPDRVREALTACLY